MSVASTLEQQMLDLINAERAAVGVAPLVLDQRLNASAEDHSEWMLVSDVFSHTGQGGSSAGDRMRDAGFDFSGTWSWGENIAWQSVRGAPGYADDVENLHDALMNSPGHRKNILSSNFEAVGLGIEVGNFNGWNAVTVTQNFAKTGAELEFDPYTGGSGGGSTPPPAAPAPTAPPVAEAPSGGNRAPNVTADDVVLVAGKSSLKKVSVANILSVKDPDGDPVDQFEFRDSTGATNFRMKGIGLIDASDGYVVDAEDLGRVLVKRDFRPSEQTLEVRASDGEDWGAWESFTLTTLSLDDWNALA